MGRRNLVENQPYGYDDGPARSVAVRSYYQMKGWSWFAAGATINQFPRLPRYCDEIAELAAWFYEHDEDDPDQASRDAAVKAVHWYRGSMSDMNKGRLSSINQPRGQWRDRYVLEYQHQYDNGDVKVNPVFEFPTEDVTDKIEWQVMQDRLDEVREALAERLTEGQMAIWDALMATDGERGFQTRAAEELGIRRQYVDSLKQVAPDLYELLTEG